MKWRRESIDDILAEKFRDKTLEEMAELFQITARGLWNIRKGLVKPRPTTLTVMSMKLKVPRNRLEAAVKVSMDEAASS